LRAEQASSTGASKPGTRRLYEFVVGLVKALIALACLITPAMYCGQISGGSRTSMWRLAGRTAPIANG
jgi:hypothetical protein